MAPTNRSSSEGNGSGNPPEPVAAQLAAIASQFESLRSEVAALKGQREKSGGSGTKYDEGDSSGRRNHHRPSTKINFPPFSSGDPRGWILKAEKYFKFYDIAEDDKVDIASMHLEGDALDLYSWLSEDNSIAYWEDFVHALHKNFGPAEFQNPDEFLCSIKQTGSVQEYRQEFVKRSARVSDWPDHCLLGVFLNGLKDELKSDVRIHKPRSVYKAMSLAMEYETKLGTRPAEAPTEITSSKSASVGAKTANQSSSLIPAVAQPPQQPPRISDEEKQSRFVKGECFRCGDKFGPGHRCKTGSLKLMEAGEIETETDHQGDLAEISLQAMVGTQPNSTLTVQGFVNSVAVSVLVDCGSTHNFISDSLLPKTGLVTHEVTPFGVKIGNGDIIRCNKVCKDVPLQLNNLRIKQDFFPFSLGGADVVLGIQWLATLNTVQANWKEMFLKFTINGTEYKLQGPVPALQQNRHQSATLHHLSVEPLKIHTTGPGAPFSVTRLEGKSFLRAGCTDTNPVLGLGHTGPGKWDQAGQAHIQVRGENRLEGNCLKGNCLEGKLFPPYY